MHGKAGKSEQLKQNSYFTVKEKEIDKNIDKRYLDVFKALYWITKEEVANLKVKSYEKFTRRAWFKGHRIIFNSFRKNTKRDDSINRRYYQKENC